jgi:hypothetical protein
VKIGIDIGRVIIGGGGDDTFFDDSKECIDTPEVEGALESLRKLYMSGEHELHFISKCGPKIEKKTLVWLRYNHVENVIPLHRTHFVRSRELKAPMALALGLDIFIDDRQDVLKHMHWTEHKILFTSWEQTNAELELIFASKG